MGAVMVFLTVTLCYFEKGVCLPLHLKAIIFRKLQYQGSHSQNILGLK